MAGHGRRILHVVHPFEVDHGDLGPDRDGSEGVGHQGPLPLDPDHVESGVVLGNIHVELDGDVSLEAMRLQGLAEDEHVGGRTHGGESGAKKKGRHWQPFFL